MSERRARWTVNQAREGGHDGPTRLGRFGEALIRTGLAIAVFGGTCLLSAGHLGPRRDFVEVAWSPTCSK
jgi:hypothetical protein